MEISLTVNGEARTLDVPANTLLVDIIREHLGLTGTHVGCDTSQCGACTVHMNGSAVKSCAVLAGQADGAEVTTIEGIGTPGCTAPHAGCLPRMPCAAMRFLHARHDHAGHRSGRERPQSSTARRYGKVWKVICAGAPATRTSSRLC